MKHAQKEVRIGAKAPIQSVRWRAVGLGLLVALNLAGRAQAGSNDTVDPSKPITKVAGATIDSWGVATDALPFASIPLKAMGTTTAGSKCAALRLTAADPNLPCANSPKKMVSVQVTISVWNNPGPGTTLHASALIDTGTTQVPFEFGTGGDGDAATWCEPYKLCSLHPTWYMDLDDHPELWGQLLTVRALASSDDYAGVGVDAAMVVRVEAKK